MKSLATVVAGASLFKFVDDLQNMQNKLLIVSNSTNEFNTNMAYVKAIADSTGQSMVAIGDVYSKVAANADKLGYNTAQVATVTNAMALALKASGASAEGARSTLYQFGQVLNKGKLNGDEFTTMTENLSSNVLDQLIKNMGITRKEFETFKSKGLVGAKDFTDALIKSITELDAMQGKTMPTLGQSLQRIQNSFADFIIKLDRASGITNALANAMNWLSKNVDTVLPILAAFVGYFVAGRILAFAVAAYEVAKGIRAIGIAASVTGALATGGISALTGLAGAAVAFAGATALFDKVDGSIEKMNVDLKQTGIDAQASLGTTNTQLTGVGEKLAEILKDLDKQIGLGVMNNRQFQIENEILSKNKDLGYQLSKGQQNELRTRLQKLEVMKAERGLLDTISQNQAEINSLNTIGTVALKTQQQIEKYRLDTGTEMSTVQQQMLFNSNKELAVANELRKTRDGMMDALAMTSMYEQNILKYSVEELDAKLQVLKVERDLGVSLDKSQAAVITVTGEYQKQLEYLKTMKSATEAINTPLQGAAAGASAAGQLGALDPMTAAQTANETLFNGLKFLRDQDLINEQMYQTAKVNAAIAASQAIMDATKKQYENEGLLRVQAQTGQQFGFDTQKQMAQNYADFKMKSDLEQTAFGIDQMAQMMTSLGQSNKKAFEAAKAFNIANAIMNTYMGATKALAMYPPPFNFIAAATVVAAGLAQVASIRSQQYSGRALGGPVIGNQPYIVGENGPELFTPNTTGSITRNSDLKGGGPTNVNFYIQANDTTGFDELLTKRKGLITQIIRDANLERGVRGTV